MSQKDTIKRMLRYIRKYLIVLGFSLVLAAGVVALTLYVPILIGKGVDGIVGPGDVDFTLLRDILVQIAVLVVATAVMQWIMNICNNYVTYQVVRDIRQDAIEKMEELPVSYYDNHPTGDIVSRVIADVDQFADGLLLGFTQLFSGVLTILITIGFMISINIKITLVVVCITPVSLFVASFIARRTYSMFHQQSKVRGEQTAYVDEMISHMKVVKAFGREKAVCGDFDEINDRLKYFSLRGIFFSSITNPATRFVNSLVYTGVGVFGAIAAVYGAITVGQLTSFLSYANQYTKPFNEISGVVTELQNALACAARIFSLIDEEAQEAEPEDAIEIQDVKGAVTISHVDFSYIPEKPLIEDFCLEVKPGQRVAIVGPTGCGKTTFINLLMRFYEVDGGSIQIDGTDIRKITRKSLRDSFGMVLQETWLASGTIRDNITMGKPEATDEEVIRAAKAAHAHSFIMRLTDGYDTVIGEDGGSLSNGQRQLLCIARVMLLSPPMLILDEATSSIDTRTEIKVQEAFAALMKGHTSFVVAHRLSTIQSADIILVMKDGHIIEQGNHQSLLAQGGFYSTLYASQFAHKEN